MKSKGVDEAAVFAALDAHGRSSSPHGEGWAMLIAPASFQRAQERTKACISKQMEVLHSKQKALSQNKKAKLSQAATFPNASRKASGRGSRKRKSVQSGNKGGKQNPRFSSNDNSRTPSKGKRCSPRAGTEIHIATTGDSASAGASSNAGAGAGAGAGATVDASESAGSRFHADSIGAVSSSQRGTMHIEEIPDDGAVALFKPPKTVTSRTTVLRPPPPVLPEGCVLPERILRWCDYLSSEDGGSGTEEATVEEVEKEEEEEERRKEAESEAAAAAAAGSSGGGSAAASSEATRHEPAAVGDPPAALVDALMQVSQAFGKTHGIVPSDLEECPEFLAMPKEKQKAMLACYRKRKCLKRDTAASQPRLSLLETEMENILTKNSRHVVEGTVSINACRALAIVAQEYIAQCFRRPNSNAT